MKKRVFGFSAQSEYFARTSTRIARSLLVSSAGVIVFLGACGAALSGRGNRVSGFKDIARHIFSIFLFKNQVGKSPLDASLAKWERLAVYELASVPLLLYFGIKFADGPKQSLRDEAVENYRQNRENGKSDQNPSRPFPQDGNFDYVEEGELADFLNVPASPRFFRVRYRAGPGDEAWMEEKDRNFLAQRERRDPGAGAEPYAGAGARGESARP